MKKVLGIIILSILCIAIFTALAWSTSVIVASCMVIISLIFTGLFALCINWICD